MNQLQLNEQIRHRHGIGFRASAQRALTPTELRKEIGKRVATADNETRLAHLRLLEMQGHWAFWDAVMRQDFSWDRLFRGAISDLILKFVINAQMKTLPSEDNLRRWRAKPVNSTAA